MFTLTTTSFMPNWFEGPTKMVRTYETLEEARSQGRHDFCLTFVERVAIHDANGQLRSTCHKWDSYWMDYEEDETPEEYIAKRIELVKDRCAKDGFYVDVTPDGIYLKVTCGAESARIYPSVISDVPEATLDTLCVVEDQEQDGEVPMSYAQQQAYVITLLNKWHQRREDRFTNQVQEQKEKYQKTITSHIW